MSLIYMRIYITEKSSRFKRRNGWVQFNLHHLIHANLIHHLKLIQWQRAPSGLRVHTTWRKLNAGEGIICLPKINKARASPSTLWWQVRHISTFLSFFPKKLGFWRPQSLCAFANSHKRDRVVAALPGHNECKRSFQTWPHNTYSSQGDWGWVYGGGVEISLFLETVCPIPPWTMWFQFRGR